MNIQIHPETTALNSCVFRAADRMRIDGCANAVANDGLSLALYCPFEALLDHYMNLLLLRVRQQAPEHRIEVYFPANTDSLLGRFNEVLASQSLNQAVKSNATVNQAQIWIVHDAQTLPESEIQLLARLIQNFPGANIRAILLMSGHPNAHKSPLSAFGRKILRWDIEAPSEEQAQAALEQARTEGNLNAVQSLIQRIQRQQRPRMDSPFDAPELLASPAPEPTIQQHKPSASKLKQQLNAFQKQGVLALQSWAGSTAGMKSAGAWLRQNNKLALGVTLALVMSTLMMLWIQPEAFGLKAAKPLVAKPLASPPVDGTAKATASNAATSGAASENTSAPALKEGPNALTSPAQTPSPQVPAPVAMATTPAETPIETPEGTMKGQEWLRKLDANTFLLQHGTASSYAKVLDIQRRHPPLKDAQIIAAYRPGEKLAHFVIVSGPYSNVGQGYEASKRPGIPRSWVRPTRGLQEQLKSPT